METLTTTVAHRDQATALRALRQQTVSRWSDAVPTGRTRVIAVASGKGGVGKSAYALNLAVALAAQNIRTALIDATPGLAHLDLLCGLNSYWNLSHFVTGARRLPEVTLKGPCGLTVATGAGELLEMDRLPTGVAASLRGELIEWEQSFEILVIDVGTGSMARSTPFLVEADRIDLLTNAEPTAIADAYALIKSLPRTADRELGIVVNGVADSALADRVLDRMQQTAQAFLDLPIARRGHVPYDPAVEQSVRERRPFVLNNGPAAMAVRQLALRTLEEHRSRRPAYFWRTTSGAIANPS